MCVCVCVFVKRWSLEGLVEVSVLITVIRTDINRCSLTHKHKPDAHWSTFVYLSDLICSLSNFNEVSHHMSSSNWSSAGSSCIHFKLSTIGTTQRIDNRSC